MLTFGLVNHGYKCCWLSTESLLNMQQASRWMSPSLMPEIRWDGSHCRNSVAWTKVLLMHLWDVSNHSRHLTQVTDMAQDSWEIRILIVSNRYQARYRTLHLDILINWSTSHLWIIFCNLVYWKLNRNGYMKTDSTSKNFKEQKYKAEDVNSSHYYKCQTA